MGQQRLDRTRAYLLGSNVPKASERIRSVNPSFTTAEGVGGGKIVITIIAKKKQ
jgi:hypothetical protein